MYAGNSILVVLIVCGLFAKGEGQCSSYETVTMPKIAVAQSKIFSDPMGAISEYDQLACPGSCHHQVAQFLVATQKSFNVSIIDLQLLIEEAGQHITAILQSHLENTDPKLAPTLVLFLNGFLGGVSKANYFLCDASQAINEAINSAVPTMTNQSFECYGNLRKMINCAVEHNDHVGGTQVQAQIAGCMQKAMAVLITAFHSFLSILDSFKSGIPQIMVDVYDCLVISEQNCDLLVMLETSKCVTHVQTEAVRNFLVLVGNASVAVPDLVAKIQMTTTNLQKCGSFYVDKYRSELSPEYNHCSRS